MSKSCYIIGTEFNYGEDPEAYLLALSKRCDYVTGQCEICPTTNRPHLQFSAYSKNPLRWGFVKCAKTYHKYGDPQLMLDYSNKEKTRFDGPWSFGTRPKAGGRPKMTCKEILETPVLDLIESNQISPLSLPKIIQSQQIYTLTKQKAVPRERDQDKKIGCWIWGPPRTGKSTEARESKPYIKMANKWWDGYLGEEEVLLEDVEPAMESWLGYFLKIWTDHWEFRAEVKGSSILIGPFSKFWITSNFHPSQIFKDATILEAIEARFEIRAKN